MKNTNDTPNHDLKFTLTTPDVGKFGVITTDKVEMTAAQFFTALNKTNSTATELYIDLLLGPDDSNKYCSEGYALTANQIFDNYSPQEAKDKLEKLSLYSQLITEGALPEEWKTKTKPDGETVDTQRRSLVLGGLLGAATFGGIIAGAQSHPAWFAAAAPGTAYALLTQRDADRLEKVHNLVAKTNELLALDRGTAQGLKAGQDVVRR